MNGAGCPEDLMMRGGRGDLSGGEAHALQAHLATCVLCRMSAAVGRAVGPLPPIGDQDEAMARRLVARQMKAATSTGTLPRIGPLPSPSTRWRLSRTLAVAAGVLLVASVASAAYWTVRVRVQAQRATAARAAEAPRSAPRRVVAAPVVAVPALVPPPPAPILALVGSPAPPAVAVPVPDHVTPATDIDPETLLLAANEARRARHGDEAIRGYRALQARFATSREAVLSHLSLGNLYLAQGAFADAVAQFQTYLRSNGAELAEEALLGEARALAALGRADDERTVWRTLQSRFPASEYLWRARQRLRELDRGTTP